jgi:putative NADH-flavin reductase
LEDLDMRIALVGATGAAGGPILDELVDRGHTVVAIVRRDNAISAPNVEQIVADAYDRASLTSAFAGVDAVISAFNPGWTEPDLYDKFLCGSRNIQQAAKDGKVARLLVVGGAGSLYGGDGRQLIEEMTIPEPYEAGVRAARDYHAEILGETELDWVFLSPPPEYGPMGPTARLGGYRTATDSPVFDDDGHSSISGPDLAIAVVDEIETPQHHRERFTAGY